MFTRITLLLYSIRLVLDSKLRFVPLLEGAFDNCNLLGQQKQACILTCVCEPLHQCEGEIICVFN